MLLAGALAFLEGLWRATRSAYLMQVWRVERWLREHRLTIAEFREFLVREKAVPHFVGVRKTHDTHQTHTACRAPDATERRPKHTTSEPKVHFNRRRHRYGRSFLLTRREFPLLYSFDSFFIESQAEAPQHSNVYCLASRIDLDVQDNRTL